MSPTWGYSVTGLDAETTARASGRDLRISFKDSCEICNVIKGMMLDEAMEFLKQVIEMKQAVPFKRFKKKGAHRRDLHRWRWHTGRYPVKAAKAILRILESVEANAMEKDLDITRLKIVHAAAQKARKIRKYIPRAFGRATPYFDQLTHVEVVVQEV